MGPLRPQKYLQYAVAFPILYGLNSVSRGVDLGNFLGPVRGYAAYFIGLAICALVCTVGAMQHRGPERRAWLFVAAGLWSWAFGELYWDSYVDAHGTISVPSPADAGYLGFYPLVITGLCLLARQRVHVRPDRNLWIDAITAALVVASICAAFAVDAVSLIAGDDNPLTGAVNFAYPASDTVLLALVAVTTILVGRRAGLTWWLLAAGLLLFFTADVEFLTRSTASLDANPFDAGWIWGMVLPALAAWRPAPARLPDSALHDPRMRAASQWLPSVYALLALVVLTVEQALDPSTTAIVLAGLSVLMLAGRLALTSADNARLLATSRREAYTDALTGLGNRRALVAEMERRLSDPDAGSWTFVMLDLDGFKLYNDRFGHPAGDVLLRRLAGRLEMHTFMRGVAYRLGGDEFCAIFNGVGSDLGPSCGRVLQEFGDGFTIGTSFGAVVAPDEAGDLDGLLRLADERLYAQKRTHRRETVDQIRDALLRTIAERDDELNRHHRDVAQLSISVALGLGLSAHEIEQIRDAAELHDVGKIAIPESILSKAAPLDDDEWSFVRRHTVIGERILSAAPSLQEAARIVRSSHERWDGNGYPDGLSRREIPLGSRIIAVCDAFDAMVSSRCYGEVMDDAQAIAELRRCAGKQFDRDVVEAFAKALARRRGLAAGSV